MNTEHPITPPPELVQQWEEQFLKRPTINGCFIQSYIAAKAAQWGADQELEACIANISTMYGKGKADWLRSMRRPKPPNLKEEALKQLDEISACFRVTHMGDIVCDKIRAALEALDD